MKPMLTFIFYLSLLALACGATLPPSQLGNDVNMETHIDSLPVKVVITSEPTDNAPRYVTTAPLNVRAEVNADSQILGTLAEGTEVTIFVLDIRGDDCYLGEWYAIDAPIAGFVCSLYIQEIK